MMMANKKVSSKKSKAPSKKQTATTKQSSQGGEGEIKRAQRLAVDVLKLKRNSEGLRYKELLRAVQEKDPNLNPNTISTAIIHLPKEHDSVIRGDTWGALFRYRKYAEEEASKPDKESKEDEIKEKSYYRSFRDWLLAEEKCEMAAITGDSRKGKREKWRIPDVVDEGSESS